MIDFALLPPEINSARMYAGPGAGSLLAAASAWQGLSSQLASSASLISGHISTLSTVWSGPSSTAMATSASRYVQWLMITAEHAQQAGLQAQAAATAYAAAFTATVPPTIVAANRAQLATLVATNLLGQNTAAIAATEAQYAEMWAQDAAAMYAYQGESAAATNGLVAFTPAPRVTSTSPLTSIFAPGSNTSTTGLAGVLNLIDGQSGSAFGSLVNSSLGNSIASSAFLNPGETIAPIIGLASLYPAFSMLGQSQRGGSNVPSSSRGGDRVPAPVRPELPRVSASAGTARNIGNLSTPSSWATEQPAVRLLSGGTPLVTEEIPASGFPPVIPPIVGNPGGKYERPRYGFPVKTIHRHPSAG